MICTGGLTSTFMAWPLLLITAFLPAPPTDTTGSSALSSCISTLSYASMVRRVAAMELSMLDWPVTR